MKSISQCILASLICTGVLSSATALAGSIDGYVLDQNGNPVSNAQIIYTRADNTRGANVVTVFSGDDGRFGFPDTFRERITDQSDISARGLGFLQLSKQTKVNRRSANLTFVLQKTTNQVDVAPASAWLGRIEDRKDQAAFIMNCIDCHQVPASEVRNYAASIDDLHASNPEVARRQSWDSIVKYMNFLSAWEFSRAGRAEGEEVNTDAVYGVENGDDVVNLLTTIFDDRLDYIEGYDWGAPVIATANTTIWDYQVPEPNAIREAVLLGDPARLWVADVSSNRIISIDVKTGRQKEFEVPADVLLGPHSLHRDEKGVLWITTLFNNTVASFNPQTEQWNTWKLTTDDGKPVGIHDLSFGFEHELITDDKGRIWFSDIGNTSVGYFDPANGNTKIWRAPIAQSRANDSALYGNSSLYGLIMTKDRKEVWYSQLGNGVFGGFNIETEEFIGPFVLPDANAGARRITISDDDVMYLALYGTGQIAEFDIKTRTMLGIYDLPDTASAPYSVTWDPVREVVWVATSNGDVIYRFDPQDQSYGVLPLPREGGFLRMIDIDPETGVLVSSYANIVENVNGPRMAFIVDPGDGAYPKKFSPDNATAPNPAD